MTNNPDKKKDSDGIKRDGKLLVERSEIDDALDKVMQEKLSTLSSIRDLVGVGGGLEKNIDSVSLKEKKIEDDISSIRSDIKRVTVEIRRLHETALKKESVKDIGGLRDVESQRINLHKQKTKMLKDLAKKEKELDGVSAEKTTLIDKYSKVIAKRSRLEEPPEEEKPPKEKPPAEEPIPEEKPPEEKPTPKEEPPMEEPIPEEKPPEEKPTIEKPSAAKPKDSKKKKGFLGFLGKKKNKSKGGEVPKESINLLKEVLPVLDDLLGKLPDDKIAEFSTTDEYETYNELYEKIKEYKGTTEQNEFIKANTKKVLNVIDNLLENLSDADIEVFSASESFKDYNRLLDLFGV